MKTTLAIMLALMFATIAGAQTMGVSGGHDLDALWGATRNTCDLETEDAVLLLEHHTIDIAADGAVATRVHRVVWIGTSRGVRSYADLRVPWNSDTSTLEVGVLRTWMGGRWWPDSERVSDTAVVHTLPYAVDHAQDYTAMRETMLLHDGVELPCIMETMYTITERGLPGADGLFVMPQSDPAARVQLTVSAPERVTLTHAAFGGAKAAEESVAGGRRSLTWTLEPAPALRRPIAVPADYEPTVAWSTWADRVAMVSAWRKPFDAAQELDAALADSIRSLFERCNSDWQKMNVATAFVADNVRAVDYDGRFWRFTPRRAMRTWETAYGTVQDRAVLLAAILKLGGIDVYPQFVGHGREVHAPFVPRLGDAGDLYLALGLGPAEDLGRASAGYDIEHDRVVMNSDIIGRVVLTTEDDPDLEQIFLSDCRMWLDVTLAADDNGGWTGTGYYGGIRLFTSYADLVGLGGELEAWTERLIASVLPGAELSSVNPVTFNSSRVELGFTFTLPAQESDDDRMTVVVGSPANGILDRLPGHVNLADATRESPVALPSPLLQRIGLRVRSAAADALHLPAAHRLENEVGRFELEVADTGPDVVVTRVLGVTHEVPAGQWPALRALLLEENDAANGTIVLKK